MHETNMQSSDRKDCQIFCMNNEMEEKSGGMTIIYDMNPKKGVSMPLNFSRIRPVHKP